MDKILQKIGALVGSKISKVYTNSDDKYNDLSERCDTLENTKVDKEEGKELMPSPAGTSENIFLSETGWREVNMDKIRFHILPMELPFDSSWTYSPVMEIVLEESKYDKEEIQKFIDDYIWYKNVNVFVKNTSSGNMGGFYSVGKMNLAFPSSAYIYFQVEVPMYTDLSLNPERASSRFVRYTIKLYITPDMDRKSYNLTSVGVSPNGFGNVVPLAYLEKRLDDIRKIYDPFINDLKIGNFHLTAYGTPSQTWQLNLGSGPLFKNSGGIIELRNTSDSAYTDLTLNNLTIKGNVTQEGSSFITEAETVKVSDNTLLLNSGETGAGVTKGIAGLEIDRGTLPGYQIVFDESDDRFKCGTEGSLQPLMLRDNEADMTHKYLLAWDAEKKIAYTTNIVQEGLLFNTPGADRQVLVQNFDGKFNISELFEDGLASTLDIYSETITSRDARDPYLLLDTKYAKFSFNKGIVIPEGWDSVGNAIIFEDALDTELAKYLPLTAGPSKVLTNSLYLGKEVYIKDSASSANIIGKSGVSGTVYIGEGDHDISFKATNNLVHHKGGTNYAIWDASNFNPSNYLPLAAGSTNPITGDLYLTTNKSIIDVTSGGRILRRTPITGLEIGNASFPTIFYTNDSALVHNRNGNSYTLWDAGNFTPGDYLKKIDSLAGNIVGTPSATRLKYTSINSGENLIDSFRPLVWGSEDANGWIVPFRNGNGSGVIGLLGNYGASLGFGTMDTHAYINVKYDSAGVMVGGGNNGKILWYKQLAFKDDITEYIPPSVGNDLVYILPQGGNEINFGGTTQSSTIYFGYRDVGSRTRPNLYIFGAGSNGDAAIKSASAYFSSGLFCSRIVSLDATQDLLNFGTIISGSTIVGASTGTTYVRSGAANLIHRRNGADYTILDSYNIGDSAALTFHGSLSNMDSVSRNGLYSYSTPTNPPGGSTYGSVLVTSNNQNPSPGTNSHWVNELAFGTNDRLYFRQRINTGGWTAWKVIAYTSDVPAVTWDSITGKPSTFTPSAHNQDWSTITGKPTSFTPAAHNQGIDTISDINATWKTTLKSAPSAYVTRWPAWGEVTGKPSSMPASDVYAWAKASAKPSYAWSEITSKPNFSTVATSGSYNDLSNKPSIPSAETAATIMSKINSQTEITFSKHVVCSSGAGTTSTSDIRFKRNLRELPDVLDWVLESPEFIYNWKDETRDIIGTSAQYWEDKIPQLVCIMSDEDQTRTFYYERYVMVLQKALKEEHALRVRERDEYKEEIRQLKEKLSSLEEDVSKIKQLLGKI